MSVLVTYASSYGSTEEVAQAIASTLRDANLDVELQHMTKVSDPAQYDAVVLGAAIYVGRLHKDARNFLTRHQDALSTRPVAVFSLGPLDEGDMESAREQLRAQLDEHAWLQPVAAEMFIGAFDPKKLRFPVSLLLKLPASPLAKLPAMDNRDWDAIRAWAAALPAQLAVAQ